MSAKNVVVEVIVSVIYIVFSLFKCIMNINVTRKSQFKFSNIKRSWPCILKIKIVSFFIAKLTKKTIWN